MSDPIASIRAAVAGRYELEREIGQGAFATVYLARDLRHERRVAFKILNADPDSEMSELRFLREIRYLARLQHPHILPLIDSGHSGAMLWYVMPYVSGESLRDRMQRERQLPVADAVSIARGIADALEYAHRNGLVHRDIKPENVLLSAGHPIVADFGIARAIDSSGARQLTRTGSGSPGTPAYMSPEQLLSDGTPIDGRSDTYSLGCVLYEMLTGKPPFPGKDGFVKRFTEPPPLASLLRRDLPVGLDDVVSTAMGRAPNERFQTAGAFCEALAAIGAGTARSSGASARVTPDGAARVEAPAPVHSLPVMAGTDAADAPPETTLAPVPLERPSRPARRHVLAAGALLAVIVIGVMAVKLSRNHLVAGRSAVVAGRVHEAIDELRAAAASDTASASASLWLAQSLLLAGEDSTPEWRRAASRAAAGTGGLVMADAERAQGLAAMAKGQYDRACASFATLHAAAPNDAATTFSLAECQARDDRVVRDSTSPSGWRFRGDRDAGIKLYQSLLEQLPSGHELRRTIYTRLPAMLMLEWGRYRRGVAVEDSTLVFGAFPRLQHGPAGDIVTYEPHPVSEFRPGQPWMNPPTMERAWERDRSILAAVANAAVAEHPTEAAPHRLRAEALELSGQLTSTDSAAPSALSEVRTALRLAPDGPEVTGLRAAEVRLLVKAGQFAAARALVDSVTRPPLPSAEVAQEELEPLAALTGRTALLVQLLTLHASHDEERLPDGRAFVPNPALAASTLAFAAYARIGGPKDSLVSVLARADREIRSFAAPRARDSVRSALLGRSLSLAAPALGPSAVTGVLNPDVLMQAQQAQARGDPALARRGLEALQAGRAGHTAAAVRLDAVYLEASLRAALGDTAQAIDQLDEALEGLPALGTRFLGTSAEAGALPRMMLLRATLARVRGDTATALRWERGARSLLAT